MIDFTQWVDQMNTTQFFRDSGWVIAAVVVATLVLMFSFGIFFYNASELKPHNSTRYAVGMVLTAVLIVVSFGVLVWAQPHVDSLSEKVNSTFNINVTDWQGKASTFDQETFWPADGTYDITYISNGTRQAADGKLIVKGHSIGITDADGVFLEGEYK